MKIEKGKRVRLKVKLQVVGGEVIEQSAVEYFQGAGTMLIGLEAAVEGLEKGATKQGTIPARQAFGDPAKQPQKTIPRSEFPAEAKLEEGSEFQAKSDNGQPVILHVIKSNREEVKVRLVHPLARKDVRYEVEVLSVTDPTPPPLPGAALVEDKE